MLLHTLHWRMKRNYIHVRYTWFVVNGLTCCTHTHTHMRGWNTDTCVTQPHGLVETTLTDSVMNKQTHAHTQTHTWRWPQAFTHLYTAANSKYACDTLTTHGATLWLELLLFEVSHIHKQRKSHTLTHRHKCSSNTHHKKSLYPHYQ